MKDKIIESMHRMMELSLKKGTFRDMSIQRMNTEELTGSI